MLLLMRDFWAVPIQYLKLVMCLISIEEIVDINLQEALI